MVNIAVVLPRQIAGKDLLNLVIESGQQVFGSNTEAKIKSSGGYLSSVTRRDFVGSKCVITFPLVLEERTKRVWGDGYRTRKEEKILNMELLTVLVVDHQYSVIEFNFFNEYRNADGRVCRNNVDIDDVKQTTLRDRFEEFLMVLYSRLSPEEAQQSSLASRVGLL